MHLQKDVRALHIAESTHVSCCAHALALTRKLKPAFQEMGFWGRGCMSHYAHECLAWASRTHASLCILLSLPVRETLRMSLPLPL